MTTGGHFLLIAYVACHNTPFSKILWSFLAVTSPNSRFFSDQSENQSEKFKSDGTETNRLDNAFKAVKEKRGSLDHFNKSLVVVK